MVGVRVIGSGERATQSAGEKSSTSLMCLRGALDQLECETLGTELRWWRCGIGTDAVDVLLVRWDADRGMGCGVWTFLAAPEGAETCRARG